MPRSKVVKMPIVQKISRKQYTVPVKLPDEKPVPARFKKPNVLPQTNEALRVHPKKEPDPIITRLQNIIDEMGVATTREKLIDLACSATISYTTLKRIIEGKTSSPHHSTVKSVLQACGHDYVIVKRGVEQTEMAETA